MPQIIDNRTNLDQTVRIFDSFYSFNAIVNAVEYDIVYSYFYSISNQKTVAGNFTTMLFRISNITGEDALILLDYIKGNSKLQTSALMAYYLNSIKSKTTLYGVSNTPSPNQLIQRNIVI